MERHISIERSPIFLRFDFISVRSHPPCSSFESSLHFPPLPFCLSLSLFLSCTTLLCRPFEHAYKPEREKKMRNEREKRGSTKKVGEKILEVVSVISIPQETRLCAARLFSPPYFQRRNFLRKEREREREKSQKLADRWMEASLPAFRSSGWNR